MSGWMKSRAGWLVLIVLAMLAPVRAVADATVTLEVYHSTTCPHCRTALPFVADLARDLPWLTVETFEISGDPANAERYRRAAMAVGATAGYVPAFIFCDTMVTGFQSAATSGEWLRRSLIACHRQRQGAAAEAPPPDEQVAVPGLGAVDLKDLSLPVTTLVLGGLDAFNPCAFFVLLFLLSLMVHARSRARMALIGGVFVGISGLVYFVFMAAWLNLFVIVGHMAWVTLVAGAVAVLVGLLNVKDYLWFHRGPSLAIPEGAKPGLFARMRGLLAARSLAAMLAGTVVLAVAANAYELLCTAGFPMVFTRILTLHDLSPGGRYLYLALYNVVYVLPLLAIVAVFTWTLGARRLREHEGRLLKLMSGLMMLGLGGMLMVAPGRLDDPLVAVGLLALAAALTFLAHRLLPRQ